MTEKQHPIYHLDRLADLHRRRPDLFILEHDRRSAPEVVRDSGASAVAAGKALKSTLEQLSVSGEGQ